MSLYFLCRKLKYLNTFSRRKRIGSLIVTYFFSILLFLLFLYDLCVITLTGNPDYSTHLAADYIPVSYVIVFCFNYLYVDILVTVTWSDILRIFESKVPKFGSVRTTLVEFRLQKGHSLV